MTEELKLLKEQYMKDLIRRDGGAHAKKTYLEIKKVASLEDLIDILEEVHYLT